MKHFCRLIEALKSSNQRKEKQQIWWDFKRDQKEDPRVLEGVISLLKNECPPALISSKKIKQWALETMLIPEWLYSESKRFVGDSSETLALILAPMHNEDSGEIALPGLLEAMYHMQNHDGDVLRNWVVEQWKNLSVREIQVFNKLITGGFRSPVEPGFLLLDEQVESEIELTVVLLYAERGRVNGRNGFKEFTMGVASEDGWLPLLKVAAELSEEQSMALEEWILGNTQEKFGPVHRLPAVQVFTVLCGSIVVNKRTKSGVSVNNPSIKNWELGSTAADVAKISAISEILPKH